LKRPSGNIELETNSDDELPDRNSTLYRENNIISKTYYRNIAKFPNICIRKGYIVVYVTFKNINIICGN